MFWKIIFAVQEVVFLSNFQDCVVGICFCGLRI